MKLIKINNKKQIRKFVLMADDLYKDDDKYVPFMKNDLYNILCKLILKDKTYHAFVVEENNKYIARVLSTVYYSKQLNLDKCGYFSHFECVNDQKVFNMLFDGLKEHFKLLGVSHMQGTYFPFDQDNRRGILVKGFEYEPMILTSYNHEYYISLFENYGFRKEFDTLAFKLSKERYDYQRVEALLNKLENRFNFYVTKVNFKNIDQEIIDVHSVIEEATNDIIFQNAPSIEDLKSIVKGWKTFLWEDFILVARKKDEDKPIGFLMAIPNYYEVFRKMKGRINPISLIKMFYYQKRIKSCRIILQYVIPSYQGKGVNYALYHKLYDYVIKRNIINVEGGTIMENNQASIINVEKAGGEMHKVFRLYGKDI